MKRPIIPRGEERGLPRHAMDRWFTSRIKNLRFVNRLDPVWGAIALGVVVAIVLVISLGGMLYPEPSRTTRVEDRRILQSFTDPSNCFVNAAPTPDGQLMVTLSRDSRCQSDIASGGTTLYDPVWRGFADQTIPFEGDDGHSDPETVANIANSTWIMGDNGGLARWAGDRWAVWASQTAMKASVRTLSDRDIAVATPSVDESKSMFASRGGAFSVYDTVTARWENFGYLPGTGIVNFLEWSGNGVWVARTSGLWFAPFDLQNGMGEPSRKISSDPVINLSLTDTGEAVALYSKTCLGQALRISVADGGCQSLVRYTADSMHMYRMLDTSLAPTDLRRQDVKYVATLGPELMLAGPKGVWRYNTATRSWTHPETRAVTVFETGLDGTLAYGGRGWVGMQSPRMQEPQTVHLPDRSRTVVLLTFDNNNNPLFTDNQSALIRLEPSGALTTVFEITAPEAATSSFVASSQTHDYFVTQGSQVSLQRAFRRYTKSRRIQSLAEMANARLYAQLGSTALGFVPKGTGARGNLVAFDLSAPAISTSRNIESVDGMALASATQALLTDSNGRLFSGQINLRQTRGITIDDLMPQQPETGPDAADVRDVEGIGDGFVLGGDWGIRIYNAALRQWETVSTTGTRSVAERGNSRQIVAVGNDEILRTYRRSSNRWLTAADIPNSQLAFNSERDILDTLISPAGQIVFLAKRQGGGVIQVYDPGNRRIVYTSNINTANFSDGKILSFTANRNWMVRLGARSFTSKGALPLAPLSRGVISGWAESASIFVTVEEDSVTGQKFLHRRETETNQSSCLYRGATIEASAHRDAFMAGDDRLMTATQRGVWVNNLATRRWSAVNLPASAYQVGMAGNRLWARSTDSRYANALYRINPQRLPAYDSCDPHTGGIAAEAFENVVVRPDNGTTFRIEVAPGTSIPRVVKESVVGRASLQLAPTGTPPPSGAPLRSFMHVPTDSLWLAYTDALARYEFSTHKWTRFPLPTSVNWSQVLIENGQGDLRGKLVVSYISGGRWLQLRLPYGAGSTRQMDYSEGAISNPGAIPGGRLSGTLKEIRQTATTLFFRFNDRIVSMDRSSRRWVTSWPMADVNAEMFFVNNRLIVYSPTLSRVYFQSGRSSGLIGAALREVEIPQGQTPMLDYNGLVSWVDNHGAVVQCSAFAVCSNRIDPAPEVDLTGVTSIRQLGDDYLLTGDDGRGVVVTRDPDHRFRRLTNGGQPLDSQSTLRQARTQPIENLRRSKDGERVYMTDRSNGFWVVDGPTPDFLSTMLSATSYGRLGVYNPDENLYVSTAKKLMSPEGEVGPIPAGIVDLGIVAVGRFGPDYWLQTPEDIVVYSPACFAQQAAQDQTTNEGEMARQADEAAAVEPDNPPQVSCAERHFPAPQGQKIAYIEPDGTDPTTFVATLQDGSVSVFNGDWQTSGPVSALPRVTRAAFLAATTFTRPDGKRSFFAPLFTTTSADGAKITVTVPRAGRAAERINYDTLQSGAMAPLDLGWLRYDAGRATLILGRGTQENVVRISDTISDTGRFLPFTWAAPAPQPDGSLIVALNNGQLRLQDIADLPSLNTASFIKRVGLQVANLVPDTGGHWRGDRFLPFAPENTVQSPDMLYRNGAFTIVQDRRETGVRMRHGQNQVLSRNGFLWDSFTDIGLGPNYEVVLRTRLGPMLMEAPRAALYEEPVVWSAHTLDTIEAATDRTISTTAFDWGRDSGRNIAYLTRDSLVSAVNANNNIIVSTAAGIGQRRGFGLVPVVNSTAPPIDLQVSRLDEAQVFGVVAGRIMQVNASGALEATVASVADDLTKLEAWRVGPLFARATGPTRTRFELRLEDSSGRESLALGANRRFRFDATLQVRFAPDGGLYMVTRAGLMGSNEGRVGLSGIELLSTTTQDVSFDLRSRPGRLYLIRLENGKPHDCKFLTTDGQSSCDNAQSPPTAMLETFLPESQSLRAIDGIRGWRFVTQYPASPQPVGRTVQLEKSRFSFDRMRSIGFCNGALFMLNNDGAILRAPSGSRWNEARFVEMQPADSQFFCKADRPIDTLPDGLWLLRPDGIWMHLPSEGQRFQSVSRQESQRARQVFSIRSSNGLSLIRRSNDEGVLQHNGHQALEITQRFGRGSPLPAATLQQRGPALEIDTPTGFFAAGARIWALTPDGVVDYGRNDIARAYFKPEDAPRVHLPTGCEISSTRRINTNETELFCGNGKMLSATVNGSVLSLSSASSQPPVWTATAGLVSVTSSTGGLQSLMLGGQHISPVITRGGFPFDSVRSAIIDGNGDYNLISAIGWWGYSHRGISLADNGGNAGQIERAIKLRHDLPALALAERVNATPAANRLCLSINNGRQLNLYNNDGVYRTTARINSPCLEFQGGDRLRSFAKTSAGTFHAILWLDGGKGKIDALVNGRFNSDRLAGLPNAQYQPDGALEHNNVCAPTSLAGVSMWGDSRFQRGRVETESCGPALTPSAIEADGSIFNVLAGGLYRLQ